MRRVLVLFAHPVLERSRVNRRLVDAIRDIEHVRVHDLYEEYPTLAIDVKREQAILIEHDVIVFQHPFFWYSAPAIVKGDTTVAKIWIEEPNAIGQNSAPFAPIARAVK